MNLLMKRGDYTYMPSPDEGQRANIVSAAVSFGCLGCSCLVLGLAMFLYRQKALRHHFQKTSTQLLYLCVAITIPQGLAFASTTLNVGKHEAAFCRFGMVFVVFGFNATNWLQCCICLNLVLALRCPTIFRYRIQTWYYISACVLSGILALVPLAFDKYSYNARSYSCWTRDDGRLYNTWQLVVFEVPILVVTIFMFISTGFVIWNVIAQRRKGRSTKDTINQLFEPAFAIDADELAITSDTNMNKRFEIEEVYTTGSFNPEMPETPVTPPSRKSPRSASWSPRTPSFVSKSMSSIKSPTFPPPKMMVGITEEHQPRKLRVARLPTTAHFGQDPAAKEQSEMRKTILRISCFPIIHLLIAVFPLIGSISLTFAQDSSRNTQLGLYLITFIGSAGLPLAYSACALLTDTSLYDAWAERRRLRMGPGADEENLELALGRNRHRLSQLSQTEPSLPPAPKSPYYHHHQQHQKDDGKDDVESSVSVVHAPFNHHSSTLTDFGTPPASPSMFKSASKHFMTLDMDTITEEDRLTPFSTGQTSAS